MGSKMKKLAFIILMLNLATANAFTLATSAGHSFSNSEIDIYISGNTCSGAGFTTTKLKKLLQNAVDDYWNQVSTSSLYLNVKDITAIDLSADTFETGINKAPANSIIAGCNGLASNDFDDGSILGAATLGCTGSTCRGIFLLNSHADSNLPGMSDSEIEAVIAHELGHAIGLGHSEYEFNLMYYSVGGKTQKWLGMDDVNGVTYLYPQESEADLLGLSLLGSCGTINLDGDQDTNSFLMSLILGILIMMLFAILNRKFKPSLKNF